MDGALVVDKPESWTSHDVVNRVRRLAGTRKVGHLGTLDPIATGVLPLLIGRATRLAQFFGMGIKAYDAWVRFGFSTSTYDRAGEPTSSEIAPDVTRESLEPLLESFRGKILQTPPPVSAKKIRGTPAYKLARNNIEVVLEPVEIEIHELTLLEIAGGRARFRVQCSAGGYVRAIAHDLGQRLGCGAHLDQLRRTQSGPFGIADAHTLESLAEGVEAALLPAAALLPDFPCIAVDELVCGLIRQGRNFPASPFRAQPAARYVKAVWGGDLVAIGEAVLPNLYHPIVVL